MENPQYDSCKNDIDRGDFSSQTDSATTKGIQMFLKFTPADLPSPSSGDTISATTAGRIPLKIRSTTWFSLNRVNTIAISRITINEGKITPPAPEKMLPLNPDRLLPTKSAVFNAMGPGMDWAMASISINSLSSSHSFFIYHLVSYKWYHCISAPPNVKAPILKKPEKVPNTVLILSFEDYI